MSTYTRFAPAVAVTRAYHNGDTSGHYIIEHSSFLDTYRWAWYEEQETPDFASSWWNTISEALRDAAADWDTNGDGGKLSGRLRQAAAGYERGGR